MCSPFPSTLPRCRALCARQLKQREESEEKKALEREKQRQAEEERRRIEEEKKAAAEAAAAQKRAENEKEVAHWKWESLHWLRRCGKWSNHKRKVEAR